MNDTLLDVNNLSVEFKSKNDSFTAVDNISFSIEKGKTLSLVGESGSGKSVTALSILQLLPLGSARHKIDSSIKFEGKEIIGSSKSFITSLRGNRISMIFQEPMTSLNPVYTTGDQVMEAIILHQEVTKAEAEKRTIELFREVGIPDPEQRIHMYPHEMSGGQKQRVMIAMALSCNPKLLIADEPTTALDVTIQAQILDLLRKLRDERGMGMIFITHDLGVIAEIADEVAVMYRGKLVEYGDVKSLYENPQHPYTKGLLACRPKLDTKLKKLPTVPDYMDTIYHEDGSYTVEEKEIPENVSWIPSHPIAGTEESGPESGFSELFKNRWCILTPSKKAKEKDINLLKTFWEKIGSAVDIMNTEQHDYILSVTSHMPHLIAYNIVNTSLDIQNEKKSSIVKYSAGGLRDFTRIAASNPIMWRDVFIQNKKNTSKMIDKFIENLKDLKKAIENEDGKKLEEIFTKTKKIREDIIEAGQDVKKPDFGRK